MADVFISYSRRDSEFVGGLARGLEGRGKDVWMDVEGIRDAEVFPAALRRAIEGSDAFVFVISPDSVTSEFCEHEVAHAAKLNKRIVPLALREVPDEQIPEEIRFRNWIPVRADGGAAVGRVVTAIETDLEWERRHTRLTVKSLEWDESGRDSSFLLRGSDLAAAERWLAEGAGKDPGPTELEQSYLLAGRQAAGRRQRTLVGASLLVAVVAIGLLIFALISRGEAVSAKSNAQAQALAAVSVTQQSVDPERAVLLGIAAVQKNATYGPLGTMFALRAALDASALRYRLQAPVQSCSSAPGSGPGMSYDPRPGSNVLAEGLCDGTVLLANATTGRVEHRVRLPGAPAITLRYTRDGSALIVVAGTHVLELDPVTGAVRREAPFVGGVLSIAVDPRAPVVAIGARRELDYWNLTDGQLAVTRSRTLSELAAAANSFQYTPDGRHLAVTLTPGPNASIPGLVLYDIARRRIVATRPEGASVIAFSPNGRELALGEPHPAGGRIVMLDSRTLRVDPRFASISAPDVAPSALAFSPDGARLAYGLADGTAGLVSAATGRPIQSFLGSTAVINAVSFTPDGKLVATASSDGAVRASRAGGLALSHVFAADLGGSVEASPEGFVSLDAPGHGVVVQRWADDGRALAAPLVILPTTTVVGAFLSPGGRFAGVLPSVGSAATGSLVLLNTSERRVVRTIRLAQLPSGHLPALSADGKFAVMSVPPPTGGPNSSPQLVLVNLRTGSSRRLPVNAAGCTSAWGGFAFSPDDRQVAAGTFCGRVSVWDVATGRQVGHTLDLGGQLAFTAFSPDGKRLAIASWDGTIKVSPVPPTGHAATLTENLKGVPQVSWSRDGRYLASAGLDHTVRIFDARSLSELRVIAQPEAVSGVEFTADSRDVISSSSDGNVWLWDACTDCESPSELLALARSRVTRTLTAQERAEFGLG